MIDPFRPARGDQCQRVADLRGLEATHERLLAALLQQAGPDDDGPEPEPATAALFAKLHHDLELRASLPA